MYSLQLGLRLGQLLNLLEPVEEVETLRVQQRAARLDFLTGDDGLDWQFDLFAINSDLSTTLANVGVYNARINARHGD